MSRDTKILIGLCWSVGGLIFVISLTLALAAQETTAVALTLHSAAQRIAAALFVAGWGVLVYDGVKRMRIVHVPVRQEKAPERTERSEIPLDVQLSRYLERHRDESSS